METSGFESVPAFTATTPLMMGQSCSCCATPSGQILKELCSVSLRISASKKVLKAKVGEGGRGGTHNDNERLLKCVIEREIEIFDIQKYQSDGSLILPDLHASPLRSLLITKTKVESEASDALR